MDGLKAKRKQDSIIKFLYYLFMLIVTVIVIFPLLYALPQSLRTNTEIFEYVIPFTWKSMIPQRATLSSWVKLFTEYKFHVPLLNTVYIAALNIIIGININALAGYAFAKYRFKGQAFLFALAILSFMFPFDAVSIPLYSTIKNFGWDNTLQGILVPSFANGLSIFLFRQFFLGIPDAMVESAKIDGAGVLKIFYMIMMPLSTTVIITASLMTFIGQWDAFMWPLLVARSNNLKMIQVALTDFQAQHSTDWTLLFSASVCSFIIPAVIMVPFQKYYVASMATSGIKE